MSQFAYIRWAQPFCTMGQRGNAQAIRGHIWLVRGRRSGAWSSYVEGGREHGLALIQLRGGKGAWSGPNLPMQGRVHSQAPIWLLGGEGGLAWPQNGHRVGRKGWCPGPIWLCGFLEFGSGGGVAVIIATTPQISWPEHPWSRLWCSYVYFHSLLSRCSKKAL